MIKIIKKTQNKNKTYRVQCVCDTIFTCEDEDLKYEIIGHGEREKVIHCPVCGRICMTGQDGSTYEII